MLSRAKILCANVSRDTVVCDAVAAAAAESVYVVAVFDIGDYVFYFFREIALESSIYCGKTYYSRISRVCKVYLCGYCLVSAFNLHNLSSTDSKIILVWRVLSITKPASLLTTGAVS